jgi:hypothetical protein
MNDFDVKWKSCAARARHVSRRDDAVPFGFAARVVARAVPQPKLTTAPMELIWQRLTWSLALVGAVLVICAVIEMPHFRDRKPLDPGIENTVAKLVWLL